MAELPNSEPRTAKVRELLALLPAKRRNRAATALEQRDARALQALNELILEEQRARRRTSYRVGAGSVLMILWALLAPSALSSLWMLGGVIGLVFAASPRASTVREQTALEIIAQDADSECIPMLLESAGTQWGYLPAMVRRQVIAALISLLREITAEDAHLLGAYQRSQLHDCLRSERTAWDGASFQLAVLQTLRNIGDSECLGVIYQRATGGAVAPDALAVRQAAQDWLEQTPNRLDFGPISQVPIYIDTLMIQLNAEQIDSQRFAVSMLGLRQLLPQLTPADYETELSPRHRGRLYQILMQMPVTQPGWNGPKHYINNTLQEEILRTLQRLRDVKALTAVRRVARDRKAGLSADSLRALAQETVQVLEAELARTRESKSLLRGATAPSSGEELLRAAATAESETDPAELLRAADPYQKERARERPIVQDQTAEPEQQVLLQRNEDRR